MPLSMFAGEQRTITITAKLPDGTTPLPLAGRTLELMIKRFRGSPDSGALTKTSHGTPGGITITDAPGGIALANLDPVDTLGYSGTYQVGVKIWPGSLEMDEDTIVITTPVVATVTAP